MVFLRIRGSRLLAILLCLLSFGLVATSQVLAATYQVSITDDAFVPATLKVIAGDSVTFINTTDATQSAKTSTTTTGFNTGNIGAGSSKTVSLTKAGTYSYSSTQTPTLKGTITVSGTTTATASATTTTTSGTLPVTGTTEVLTALVFVGLSLLAFGAFSGKLGWFDENDSVISLPAVESYNKQSHDQSHDHPVQPRS